VRVDQSKQGVQVGHRIDRKLRVISDRVVLVGDVDSGDTGIGRLGAIELAVPSPQPRGDHPGEALVDTAVGPIRIAEHQESEVRVLSCLHKLDLLVDRDLRALRITLNEVGRVRGLLTHRRLQVGKPDRNRRAGKRFGCGDQHRGVAGAGSGVDVVGDDGVLPELAGCRRGRAAHHQRIQRVSRVVGPRGWDGQQCAGEQRDGQVAIASHDNSPGQGVPVTVAENCSENKTRWSAGCVRRLRRMCGQPHSRARVCGQPHNRRHVDG
jgi:hypothetical protein